MSALHAVAMPKWGLAMQEGTVTAWLKETGAQVVAGEDLAEIETSKITNVFESPVSGRLLRRMVPVGGTVPVGALIAVVGEGTEAEVEAFAASFVAAPAEEEADSGPSPQQVDVGGRRIRYLEQGAGEGAPILLVHGFGGDALGWMFLQPLLAAERRTLALELPGHGGSEKRLESGSLEELAGTVLGFADALGLERAHLVGHSLGGAVALQAALSRPGFAASLSLLAPAGLGPEVNAAFIEGYVTESKRRGARALLEQLVADPALVSREMIEEVLRYKRLDGVEACLRLIAGELVREGRQARLLRERLAEPGVPLQLVWGSEDAILPASQAGGLPPEIRVALLERVGHLPHLEAPGETARLVLATAARGTV